MNESTCLLCLAVNRRTFDIINTHLQTFYEKLVSFKIQNSQYTLCYICHKRLQQCYQMWQLATQTQKLLTSFLNKQAENNLTSFKSLVELSTFYVPNVSIHDDVIIHKTDVKQEYINENDLQQSNTEDNLQDFTKLEEVSIKQSSDSEDDVPLKDISSKRSLDQFKTNNDKTEKKLNDCKDIKIDAVEIMLSEEEQISEFLQRAKSLNYVHSPYKCDVCYRGFVDPAAYEKHQEKHDERMGPHECRICHFRYPSGRQLRSHVAAAHARRYACTRCPNQAHTRYQAKEHEKWHRGHKYTCHVCGLNFSKPTTYLTHQRKWHSVEHVCDTCGECFASRHGLMLHRSKSHRRVVKSEDVPEPADERFCKDCNVQFETLNAWKRHVLKSNKHSVWNDNKECKICGIVVGDQNRKYHMRLHAKDLATRTSAEKRPQMKLACSQCGAFVKTQSNLKAHVRRVHMGVKYNKNLVCEVCGKNCTSNATLRYHQRRHTGERPYACECGARFSDSNQLRTHRRVHSGERPYACTVCAKAFSQKTALNKHYRVHTGAKPYECQFCKRSFSQSNSLKGHVRAVHLKLPPNNRKKNQTEKSKKEEISHNT